MKKFFILATYVVASLFATKAWAEAPASPENAPAAPTHDVANVKALYCNTYTENNLSFDVSPTTGWQELTLSGTKVRYTENFSSCTITSTTQSSYDCSGYPKFHFDVWVPEAGTVEFKFIGENFEKQITISGLNANWNTIDADLTWWTTDYDFSTLKSIVLSDYKISGSIVTDQPIAFTNFYFWKEAEVDPATRPATAPAVPGIPEDKVYALFSATYQTNTYNFEPLAWGGTTAWESLTFANGQKAFYTPSLLYDACTNWGASSYNFTKFDAFHIDIWVTVDSKIKITFEALKKEEGGSGWKDGATFDLKGNQWNSVKVDLLNAPYQTYDFKDCKYLVLEGFVKTDGTSAEKTPFAVANAYFGYAENIINAVENVSVQGQPAVKKIVNGQLVIEKDGKRYNALGVEL